MTSFTDIPIFCGLPLTTRPSQTCRHMIKYELWDVTRNVTKTCCGRHIKRVLSSFRDPSLIIVHFVVDPINMIQIPNPYRYFRQRYSENNDELETTTENVTPTELLLVDRRIHNNSTSITLNQRVMQDFFGPFDKRSLNISYIFDLPKPIEILTNRQMKYIVSPLHIQMCEEYINYDEKQEDVAMLGYYCRMFPKRICGDNIATNNENNCDHLEKKECNICFDTIDQTNDALTLHNCKHSFHKDCIMKWFTPSVHTGKGSCPICRTAIEVELKEDVNPNIIILNKPKKKISLTTQRYYLNYIC